MRLPKILLALIATIGIVGVAVVASFAPRTEATPVLNAQPSFLQDSLALPQDDSGLLMQDHPTDSASAPPEGVIDGAKNPESIPDSVAYRLYFTTVGTLPNPTEGQRAIQKAQVRLARLSDADAEVFLTVLAEFKVQHADLIQRYNDSVEIVRARGEFPDADYETFVLQQDALVQATRDRLRYVLDPNVVATLHAHIQKEKRRMKINPGAK